MVSEAESRPLHAALRPGCDPGVGCQYSRGLGSRRALNQGVGCVFSQYDESPDWRANGAGFYHSHKHGFGLLNAWRMVNAAKVPAI